MSWSVPTLSHLDPRSALADSEVQRIIELENVADSMPDAFTDLAKMTRSHIPAANVPARIDIPQGGCEAAAPNIGGGTTTTLGGRVVAEVAAPQRKRGRPTGSMDTRPRKRGSLAQLYPLIINTQNPTHEIIPDYSYVREKTNLEEIPTVDPSTANKEISMNYASVHEILDRESVILDDAFAFSVAQKIIEHDDIEPRFVEECQHRAD